MTDQEIEKLREKLGSDYSVKRQNGAITVELVDIWNGVEFAECVTGVKVDRYGKEIIKGNIYPIYEWFEREVIYIDNDGLGWQSKHFRPSTEAAYVEQLKAKAKELYGEINDGDRFVFTWIGNEDEISIRLKDKYDFYYDKESDALDLNGFPLYRQGKWAKKIYDPVVVAPCAFNLDRRPYSIDKDAKFSFIIKNLGVRNFNGASAHLAKCLEDYLNSQ